MICGVIVEDILKAIRRIRPHDASDAKIRLELTFLGATIAKICTDQDLAKFAKLSFGLLRLLILSGLRDGLNRCFIAALEVFVLYEVA